MTPKIFLFCEPASGWAPTDVVGFALAEDGDGLASHLSSNKEWSQHDMGLTSDWKHDVYSKHYPEGYELVWLDDPENNSEFMAAIDINKKNSMPDDLADDIADAEREARFGKGL